MKISITYRLFLAILASTTLAVISMFLIMQWSIGQGFLRYVNTMEQIQLTRIGSELEEAYASQGSWGFLRNNPVYWRQLVLAVFPGMECQPPGMAASQTHADARDRHPARSPVMQSGRQFLMRLLVLDDKKNTVVGPERLPGKPSFLPLRHQDQIVGYLGLLPLADLTDDHQLRFIKEQKLTLALVTLLVVLAAASLTLPLAGRLVKPLKALTAAARKMAAGEFSTRVTANSTDEIGQLAQDFNLLALTLEKNEKTRRQWVADISHELRTPLAVLRAEIEALEDGVRPVTAESINSLHGEVIRLSRLVDDLYQLSLSDLGGLTYHKEKVDLTGLVNDILIAYQPEFETEKISLEARIVTATTINIFGDPERLRQLLTNLLDNSLKYTDPGGQLIVTLGRDGDKAILDFQDSLPGVPEEKLDRLFERLFRAETSRSRAAGGAGLGLAICKNIVEAHAGRIIALPSPLGGIWLRITLPVGENS